MLSKAYKKYMVLWRSWEYAETAARGMFVNLFLSLCAVAIGFLHILFQSSQLREPNINRDATATK